MKGLKPFEGGEKMIIINYTFQTKSGFTDKITIYSYKNLNDTITDIVNNSIKKGYRGVNIENITFKML